MERVMLKNFASLVLITIALMQTVCAAQSAAEREAEVKQAAAEDAAALKANPESMFSNYSGKLVLFTKEQREEYADCGAVGTFTTDKTVYLIKLDSEKKIEMLKPFDGKTCTATAKIRNDGKYIIIQKMILPGADYVFPKRRGGVGM